MNDPRLQAEARLHTAIRDDLLRNGADELDEQTLADTLEGCTNLHEMLARIIRGARRDKANADGLRQLLNEEHERLKAIEERYEHRRAVVAKYMIQCDIKKMEMPDFTASLRAIQPHVILTDEAAIPSDYIEMRPHIQRQKISDTLKAGREVPGATLSNAEMGLTVRTR